ncbi:hypothetical protein LSAT2_000202 [Lamellibrachia satsuma]|nr:hypothetical protein LSAT2_000202 [Lamellibrachia satsuma]
MQFHFKRDHGDDDDDDDDGYDVDDDDGYDVDDDDDDDIDDGDGDDDDGDGDVDDDDNKHVTLVIPTTETLSITSHGVIPRIVDVSCICCIKHRFLHLRNKYDRHAIGSS